MGEGGGEGAKLLYVNQRSSPDVQSQSDIRKKIQQTGEWDNRQTTAEKKSIAYCKDCPD
jgi:hypothetical protein